MGRVAMRRLAAVAVGAAIAAAPSLAGATFSVLAADPARGLTGGAVASCVPLVTVLRVYGAAPGAGRSSRNRTSSTVPTRAG